MDGAELVELELTFWHKDKKPGDRVRVRADEVRSWHGFAKPVTDKPAPAQEPAARTDEAPKTTTAPAATAKKQ